MQSIRAFARSAPRSISRLTSVSAARSPAVFGVRATPSISRFTAPFSTTFARRQGNEELVAKLTSEYDAESSSKDEESEISQSIKDYLADSPFELVDTPGVEDVVLTRKYNDEEIRVTFSIADLNAENFQENAMEEDRALYDEPEDVEPATPQGTAINQGNKRSPPVATEDSIAAADAEEEAYEEPAPAVPTRINVRVTRDGKPGATLIEATAQDGEILVDNVYYFPEGALADPETAEQEWKRRSLYAGPPFSNLDDELQVLLERYLEERGVDVRLAQFVPDYMDFKEQKEYLNWLQGLKSFLQ